jgi:hypothetical protein
MMSVSKLCCPVCWELLDILNEVEPRLTFPGCHSNIYPIELPAWIPTCVVDKITNRFQAHLQHELEIMVQRDYDASSMTRNPGLKQRKGHASHESESNISVASTNRDQSDDENEFKFYQSSVAETHL